MRLENGRNPGKSDSRLLLRKNVGSFGSPFLVRDIRVIGLRWWQHKLQEYGFVGYYVKLIRQDKIIQMFGPFTTSEEAYEKLLQIAEGESG
jgi:hypothetical protein